MKSSKDQRTYMLTPRRKAVGKAVAWRSMKKLANECLSDDRTRHYILLHVGKIVLKEMKGITSCHESIFGSKSIDDLKHIKWIKLYDELKRLALVFSSILISATRTRTPRNNQIAVVCVCVLLFSLNIVVNV